MKKILVVILSAMMVASLIGFAGCKLGGGKNGGKQQSASLEDCPQFISKTLVDFTEDITNVFEVSDARGNGDPFGVIWNKNNVSIDKEQGLMTFSLTKEEDTYYGSEIKTNAETGGVQYGYFGCIMKPSNVYGTASTFFTYTGAYEGNSHDEIDIEFLGKDTTKVQFNYFLNDVGGHEYWYDLGFDASEDFHQYGFYWDEEMMVWYVDYKPVYCVRGDTGACPQRVYTNFWSGETTNEGIMGWMGQVDDETLPATTVYKEITVAYLNGRGIDIPEPEYVPSEEEFTPSAFSITKGATDIYTLTQGDNSTTVTYTAVAPKSYKNVYGVVAEQVKDAEYVGMKIRNNGTDDYVKVRVDVQAETVNTAGIKAINAKAWMNGEQVKTDLTYGGSFFDIQPGEEAFCVVKFYGVPVNVLFMIDSCTRTDKEYFAGSVTVSDFGYTGTNNYVYEYVNISSNYELLKTGETVQLTATGSDEVKWSVENPNVVSVKDGLVTALKEGTTVVYAACGSVKAGCTIKVSNADPKTEETMEIVSDELDKAKVTNLTKTNGTYAKETTMTYGASKESILWTGVPASNVLYLKTGKYNVTADGYIEFFLKNIGHTTSTNGESMNGVFIQLYDEACTTKIGSEVKAYKAYNAEYSTEAGNGWYYWKLPLSLFGADNGTTFGAVRFKIYAAMDAGESMYFDGVKITAEEVSGGQGGEGGGEQGGNEPADHTAETLTICAEADDILDEEHQKWANGTAVYDTENYYGNGTNSTNALKWTGFGQYENMMFFVNADKSAVTITADGYLEIFIKDVGHTSSTEDRASGLFIRLYNGDDSTKVDGTQDVKIYKTYNADCRTDAGNGWSYYKLPLTLFGTAGASFDRMRLNANAASDAGEVMYLDGLKVVTTSGQGGQGGEGGGQQTTVDHSAETLAICTEADDILDDQHKMYANGTVAYDTDNYYGNGTNSTNALKWTGFVQYGNFMYYANADKSAMTISANGYLEFFIKNVGHTSSAEQRASGVFIRLFKNGTDKVDGAQNVNAYKNYNAECRTDAGNGWSYYKLPLSLFGTDGASFDRIQISANVAPDEGEATYFDGMRVVIENGQGGGEQPANDHSAETLTICTDAEDMLKDDNKYWINGTSSYDTENYYGNGTNSKNALKWSGCAANENMMLYVFADKTATTISANAYLEFFIKDVGHTSDATERASGVYFTLYNGSTSTKVDGVQTVKAYKAYNAEYRTDAGNGWSCYKLPLTLFGTDGASFDRVRVSASAAFDESEVMYLDGMHVITAGGQGGQGGEGGGEQGGEQGGGNEQPTVDHTAETLTICTDAEEITNDANVHWINGTHAFDTDNYYGNGTNSKKAFKWTGCAASENMMLYVNADHSTATIVADGYIEFFIKDVGHTSSTEDRASGVILRLYNGSSSTKVDGSVDAKAYKAYSANYRTDAGNGWYCYRIPLSTMGTAGATFDRVRFATNVAFDTDEIMYLDGVRFVAGTQGEQGGGEQGGEQGGGNQQTTVDHTAETLVICTEADDIIDSDHLRYSTGTVSYDTENYYGNGTNSTNALKWTGFAQYGNFMFFVNADRTATAISSNTYLEFYIKVVGHTSDATVLASGVVIRLYNGGDSTKAEGALDVKAYKAYNAEYRTDAGNGWYRFRLPMSLFGEVGVTFDRIRFSSNAAPDEGEAMYFDGMRIVTENAGSGQNVDNLNTSNFNALFVAATVDKKNQII